MSPQMYFARELRKKSAFVTKWVFTNPIQKCFSQCVCWF